MKNLKYKQLLKRKRELIAFILKLSIDNINNEKGIILYNLKKELYKIDNKIKELNNVY